MAVIGEQARASAVSGRIDFETLILRAATLLTSVAAATFVAASLGLPMPTAYAAGVVPAMVVAALVRATGPIREDRRTALTWALLALGGAWVLLLFARGAALPPGDPIAVPQLARSVAAGQLPSQAFAVGSSGHAYPPGYPILFAPVVPALSPLAALAAFKVATLACLALIPAAWAWLHLRSFGGRDGFHLVLGAAYVAFFVLERTLGFVTPFAGKNAVLAGLVLFPGVMLSVLALCRRPFAWPLAALPLYGLVLIHYTMLHLAAAFLASYFAFSLGRAPKHWLVAARVAAAGFMAAGLFLLMNRAALTDARAGGFGFQPIAGVVEMAKALLAAEPGFVTFAGTDYIPPAPFRGLVLLACCALCLVAERRAGARGLGRAAAAYLVAFLCSLGFAMGVVPGGVKLDFVRWFAWPLQAGVFLCAGLATVAVWRRIGSRRPWLRWAPVVGVAGLALASLVADGRPERGFFRGVSPRQADLEAVAAHLQTRGGACVLIGDSVADPAGGVVVQRSAAWNYAEAVSGCRFLNGSWMQAGAGSGRAADGYPAASSLRALPPATPLYFVGRPAAFAAYRRYLGGQGVALSWTRLGEAPPDGAVWRATNPPARGDRPRDLRPVAFRPPGL